MRAVLNSTGEALGGCLTEETVSMARSLHVIRDRVLLAVAAGTSLNSLLT
jgi:hypothetical protein